ncbi:MAG: DUF4129 domain-containing protein [Ignavibacteriales bacterium]
MAPDRRNLHYSPRTSVVKALTLIMEMVVWYAWQIVILSAVGSESSLNMSAFGIQILAIAAGCILAEHLYQRKVSLGRLRTFIGVGGISSSLILAAISRVLSGAAYPLSIMALLFLWWRGAVVAQYYRYHGILSERFSSLTLKMILLLILLATVGVSRTSLAWLVACVAAFFVTGLLALATAGTQDVVLQAEEAGERGHSRGRTLRRTAVVAAFAMVTVPAVAGWLLAGYDVAGAGAVVRSFFLRVAGLLEKVLLPIAMLVGWLLEPVVRWMAGRARQLPPIQMETPLADEFSGGPLRDIPSWLLGPVLGAAIVIAACVVVIIFVNSIWLREDPEEESIRETRESIWSWTEIPWLTARRSARPLRRECERENQEDIPPVRKAYRRLLAIGLEIDVGRGRCETPYEYLPRFLTNTPVPREAVEFLTNLYVRVRYGGHTTGIGEREEVGRQMALIEQAVRLPPGLRRHARDQSSL